MERRKGKSALAYLIVFTKNGREIWGGPLHVGKASFDDWYAVAYHPGRFFPESG